MAFCTDSLLRMLNASAMLMNGSLQGQGRISAAHIRHVLQAILDGKTPVLEQAHRRFG